MPQRIQLSRRKGYRKPEGAVVVSRPTRWGNPYRWTEYRTVAYDADGEAFRVSDSARRRYAVVDFEASLHPVHGYALSGYPSREEIQRELRGKDLACWCPLPAPGERDICHAAALLRIANASEVSV